MAGFGSCLGSLLGMNNQTYGVIAGNGISYSISTTDGLCLNNIQYYTVPTTYNTATTSSITITPTVWGEWINESYVMASDGIWQVWNQGFGAGTGNMQAAGAGQQAQEGAWNQLGNGNLGAYRPDPGVIRQIAEGAARRQQEEVQRQAVEARKVAEVAESTAERLLVEHLDEKQLEQFRNHRYFEVILENSRRVYRIKHGWAGNIEVFEDGRLVETMCIHPRTQVPHSDNLLAQKLLLEADEFRFRQIANITRRAA